MIICEWILWRNCERDLYEYVKQLYVLIAINCPVVQNKLVHNENQPTYLHAQIGYWGWKLLIPCTHTWFIVDFNIIYSSIVFTGKTWSFQKTLAQTNSLIAFYRTFWKSPPTFPWNISTISALRVFEFLTSKIFALLVPPVLDGYIGILIWSYQVPTLKHILNQSFNS